MSKTNFFPGTLWSFAQWLLLCENYDNFIKLFLFKCILRAFCVDRILCSRSGFFGVSLGAWETKLIE